MSPGPIFEPEGQGTDFAGAARALFAAGFRARRHRPQLLRLSPDARRLHVRIRRARARLRGHSRRGRQHRAAGRGDRRACSPDGYTGTPDFLKCCSTRREMSGKDVSSIKRGLVSGAALPPSLRRGAGDARRRGPAVLRHRRDRRHRLRDAGARGHGRQREHHRRDRAAGHRRSGRRGRGRRGGRDLVQSATIR